MPDADGFEPRLPGRADAAAPGFAHWGAALAALPQEAPAPGGWQRVRSRLPAPRARRTRWPAWGALAASLALAVAIPLQHRPGPADAVPAAGPVASRTAPAPHVAVVEPDAAAIASPAAGATRPAAIDGAIASAPIQARAPDTARRTPRSAPVEPVIRTLAPAAGTPMLADAGADAELQALQDQSAQLEGLLALARDERVSSGAASALSHELDAQVASIDAALIQPGLDPARRAALWGERVDALQQLAGIETTNRLYAARGQTYDVALIGVD